MYNISSPEFDSNFESAKIELGIYLKGMKSQVFT